MEYTYTHALRKHACTHSYKPTCRWKKRKTDDWKCFIPHASVLNIRPDTGSKSLQCSLNWLYVHNYVYARTYIHHITLHMRAHIQIYKHPRRQETDKFVTAVLTVNYFKIKQYYYQRISGPAVFTQFAARNKSPY
jgi:hypothetical protein